LQIEHPSCLGVALPRAGRPLHLSNSGRRIPEGGTRPLFPWSLLTMPASHYPVPSLPPPSSLPPVGHAGVWEDHSAIFELVESDEVEAANREAFAELARLPAAEHLSPEDVGQLFSSYRGFVAKIGRKILGPTGDVDDLIQDVFLATVRDIHKLRDRERVTSWLGTVTTRMAKRRRWRSASLPAPSAEDPAELLEQEVCDAPSPESSLDLAGSVQALLSLPDELRTPWVLRHVEGRTLEDVAQQCDCSLSTAQRRIQTASGRLHRRYR
jgi:RNA polymerase sigma-70 factor (ECF subfamily)